MVKLRNARRAISLLSAIVLAAPVMAWADASGRLHANPPPPPSQFYEGDSWTAPDRFADGSVDVFSHTTFALKKGAWVVEFEGAVPPENLPEHARQFAEAGPDDVVPRSPVEGLFYASPDGLLHRFEKGKWIDIAIGDTITDAAGNPYKFNQRVTPFDADELRGLFAKQPPNLATIGKNEPIIIAKPAEVYVDPQPTPTASSWTGTAVNAAAETMGKAFASILIAIGAIIVVFRTIRRPR